MTAQLVSEVLSLPVAERLHLVEEIWDSLPADAEAPASLLLTAEQEAELNRRADAHAADPSSSIGWDAVQQRIQDRFGLRL
ncbi:MAG: addiction module protein [Verrucomicrobiaceae bacterium]|nr:addiction module protein [Verrucomicrobiaceae bacterium]